MARPAFRRRAIRAHRPAGSPPHGGQRGGFLAGGGPARSLRAEPRCAMPYGQQESGGAACARYVIGVDMGSTVVKCHVYDRAAAVRGSSCRKVNPRRERCRAAPSGRAAALGGRGAVWPREAGAWGRGRTCPQFTERWVVLTCRSPGPSAERLFPVRGHPLNRVGWGLLPKGPQTSPGEINPPPSWEPRGRAVTGLAPLLHGVCSCPPSPVTFALFTC